MLNTNVSSTSHYVQFNDIFVESAKSFNRNTTGRIFREDNFAKGWNSLYAKPTDLSVGKVEKGMRVITQPSILISTKNARMAFVLASEEEPVFFTNENTPLSDGAYLLSFIILPLITPEYIYYMCKYGTWEKIVNNIENHLPYEDDFYVLFIDDDQLSWERVGKQAAANGWLKKNPATGVSTIVDITVKILKNGIKDFTLPSLTKQNELVDAAISQEKKIAEVLKPNYEVSELVNRYLTFTFSHDIFQYAGLGLLAEAYRVAAGYKVNTDVIRILSQYEYCKDVLSGEEIEFLGRNLNEVFKTIISSNRVTPHPSDGFIQPHEVTDFMCKMASFPENVSVYNPFAGADSYGISLPNLVIGEEINPITWALGQIRIFANHAENHVNIKLGDSFESMASNKKFKAIISSPAYLSEKGQRIADVVKMLYAKLDNEGKLVCIVSAGFLSGQDNNTRAVRECLIRDKAIASVVMLPSNIFMGTGVSQAALVITKGVENKEILFADATGYTGFANSVYRATTFDVDQFLKDLEENVTKYLEGDQELDISKVGAPIGYSELFGSNLTPSYYLTPKPIDGISLTEIATEVEGLRGKDISAEYFITGSSIPAAMHRKPFVPSKVEDGKVSTKKKHVKVPENAVILAIVGGNIRTVYTESFTEKIAFPDSFVKVLEPKADISAKYLAAVLSTKVVADQIKAQTSGLTIPRINKLDLEQIIVPLHGTVEEREQLISDVLSSEINDLEGELQEILDSQKREVRSTRHAMIQTLTALSSNWEHLQMFAERHKNGITLSDITGRINPMTVRELMESIGHAISTLQRQVESLRFEKPDWGKDVAINPYKFINDYIAMHSSPFVRMVNVGNDNVADLYYIDEDTGNVEYLHEDAEDIFYAPERVLERIFNNIVANAKAHGFESDSENNEIRFDWKSEDGGIVITIANNGAPLKSGVSGEDVLMSGFTTALNKNAADGTLHSGQGGFEIKSLMKGLGNVEVISLPEAEFPVIYKLTFEKTNFETINLFED